MAQMIVYFDDKENKIIEKLSKRLDKSKMETVKEIVRNFKEEK